MCRIKSIYQLLSLLISIEFVFCEICELQTKINVSVYSDIDSRPENVTIENRIQYKEDIFYLEIHNQLLPKLCDNLIRIENELSVLQINNCSVQEITPNAFNITPTLTLLRIINNPLTTIKKGIFNQIRVKEIDLSYNHIITIDQEAFDNNTHLEILKLNNNELKEINPNWFYQTPNIYKLSIIYNDLRTIEADAFRNMAQHRPLKLRLSANRITEIDPQIFGNHTNIGIFRINGNKLKELPGEMFKNRTIEQLHVNTNLLKCFPDTIYESNVKLLVFVDNISFECDCLKKIRQFVNNHNIDVWYPSIICEDRIKEVNIVFNYNSTVEIPLIPPTVDVDVYIEPNQTT